MGPGLALGSYWAKGRTKGIAQNLKGIFTAGHSHRRTSGGTFEAKPKMIGDWPR